MIALGSRRVVQVGVTRQSADAPVTQQPRYLIRDNDREDGRAFAQVAKATGIVELRMAYRALKQNAPCERFLGSVRHMVREWLRQKWDGASG